MTYFVTLRPRRHLRRERRGGVQHVCLLKAAQPRHGAEAGRECGERAGQGGQSVHVRGGEEGDTAEEPPVSRM